MQYGLWIYGGVVLVGGGDYQTVCMVMKKSMNMFYYSKICLKKSLMKKSNFLERRVYGIQNK